MLKAGERAPEFTLPDDTETDRSLTELLTQAQSSSISTLPTLHRAARARPARCAT